ncbi:MAG: archaetidylserine decarboxylase [Halioglobus sp.]
MAQPLRALSEWEQLNFLLTNRIPRGMATRFMGWLSRVESPLLARVLISGWGLFADDLNLSEARTRDFASLHECFTRELLPGARTFDSGPRVVCSPSDGVVGAFGNVEGTRVFQAKGFPYELEDLIPDPEFRERYRDGVYVTLRLKSSMYHRFHAPLDGVVRRVIYISGDTWNVNPIALKRIEKLYCKNERAVLELWTEQGDSVCLVPVAAILVASMHLNCIAMDLDSSYDGPATLNCHREYKKGDELGYFQHGSTIIVFAAPGYTLNRELQEGSVVRAGTAILERPDAPVVNGRDLGPHLKTG